MKVIILGLVFITIRARANWVGTGVLGELADNPIEVASVLKQEYSPNKNCLPLVDVVQETLADLAAGLPIDPVTYIFVTQNRFEWRGETTCSENDSRLTQWTCSGVIKKKTDRFSFREELMDIDPCSINSSPLKKFKKVIK